MKKYKKFLLIAVAFFAGTLTTTTVLAHNGDISLIHACYKTNTGGSFRIVSPNDNCNPNTETALDWNIQGIQGPPGPGGSSALICSHCTASDILARTNTSDLSGENFDFAVITNAHLYGQDLSGSSFVHAILSQLQANTDPTNPANFTNANFTDANLMGSNLWGGVNFTGANLTRANLSTADLTDAIMTGATVTDVIWNHTNCPDGTNSDDNGNTCLGHLTP